MLKIALIVFPLLSLTGDRQQQYIVGEPEWLLSEECTLQDPMQCAVEKHVKERLREGPVVSEPLPDIE